MLIGSGRYAPTILAGSRRRVGDGRSRTWSRGVYELVAVEEGRHRVCHDAGSTTCDAGAVYLLGPGQRYTIRCGCASRSRCLRFIVAATDLVQVSDRSAARRPVQPDHIQPGPQAVWGLPLPLRLTGPDPHFASNELSYLTDHWWRGPYERFTCDTRLARLLEIVVTIQRTGAHGGGGIQRVETEVPAVRDAIVQARREIGSLPSVADLARRVGLSRSHFSRLFMAEMGEGPATFLRRSRRLRAMELLRTTDWSVMDVAEQVGYRGIQAMDRAFREAGDAPPREWRRMARQQG